MSNTYKPCDCEKRKEESEIKLSQEKKRGKKREKKRPKKLVSICKIHMETNAYRFKVETKKERIFA